MGNWAVFVVFNSLSAPRVCDACKETEENGNEIVDSLCKNDFGKCSGFTSPEGELQRPQEVNRGGSKKFKAELE